MPDSRLSRSVATEIRVLVLSNQAEAGLLWDGAIEVEMPVDGPLAVVVLRELRERGVAFAAGDLLFFPDGAPKHRAVEVGEHGTFARHHGWAV